MKSSENLFTYLAGAIEHASSKQMISWRDEFKQKLTHPSLLIYDPVAQEAEKVGKPSGQQVEYIKGLKQAGHWTRFFNEMWKIWFSKINKNRDFIDVFRAIRNNKHLYGTKPEQLREFGDYEAVLRCDFMICYYPKDVKTVGTIYEVVIAFLFGIPIYLILPDSSKTEINSSLLFGVMLSEGEVFYNINDCVKHIQQKYNLEVE